MDGQLALTAEQSLDSVLLMTAMDASWKETRDHQVCQSLLAWSSVQIKLN